MVEIFREDFETGTTTMTPVVNQTGNTVEVTDVSPINGVYSARCHIIDVLAWSAAALAKDFTPTPQGYAEVLLRLDSFTPSRGDSRTEMLLYAVSNMFISTVGLNANRQLFLRYLHLGSILTASSTTTLELGTAYKIGLEVHVGTNVSITVTVNGVGIPELTISGIDNSAALPISRFNTGLGGYALDATVTLDDFAIDDLTALVTHQLTVSATTGGTTDPMLGAYTYNEDATATVTAFPDTGYILDHWELDGVNVGFTNPINITMDVAHIINAVFAIAPTPVKHTLSVDSTPIQGIPFTIEAVI